MNRVIISSGNRQSLGIALIRLAGPSSQSHISQLISRDLWPSPILPVSWSWSDLPLNTADKPIVFSLQSARIPILAVQEQLDQAMVALREVLLVTIIRQQTSRDQLDIINRGAPGLVLDSSCSSSCEPDSPVLSRRVLLNNNTLDSGDNMKSPERKVKEGTPGLLGGRECDIAAGTSPSVRVFSAVTSSPASPAPVPPQATRHQPPRGLFATEVLSWLRFFR